MTAINDVTSGHPLEIKHHQQNFTIKQRKKIVANYVLIALKNKNNNKHNSLCYFSIKTDISKEFR